MLIAYTKRLYLILATQAYKNIRQSFDAVTLTSDSRATIFALCELILLTLGKCYRTLDKLTCFANYSN